MYINTPGGSVSAGLAIVDTMNFIKSDVQTIVMGMAASMGTIIASSGAKGKRFMLPNACLLYTSGEKPGKVAVETPEKLELHTNKEMAKELGIDISSLKVEK